MLENKINVSILPLGKTIQVAKNSLLKDIVFKYGVEFPCGGEGYCGGCKVKLLEGDVKDPNYHKELNYKLDIEQNYRLACISEVTEDLKIEIPQLESVILSDESKFNFKPKNGIGIAVDLGTTTIVAQLINLTNGKIIGVRTKRNPQLIFGSDIMSRVQVGLTSDGRDNAKKIIRDSIYEMIIELVEGKLSDLNKVILVGNTVMHHLFCGFDTTLLSRYPFKAEQNESVKFTKKELNWPFLSNKTEIIFIRPIESFIGSDILAGIVSTGLFEKDKISALIDLGTNGEIVIGNNDKIVCASTAAGPAFEGANIEMGMSAMTGAIASVTQNENQLNYKVIGNDAPRGICGSGLIDAIKIFLDKNLIDQSGLIINDDKLFVSDNVYISQKDIREFQLAKAAISAGFKILLNKIGKGIEDLDNIYVAGGFGYFINVDNVSSLGMIEGSLEKIKKIGNSSLLGAKMMLFMDEYGFNEIINKIEHISLDTDLNFHEIFVEKIGFYGASELSNKIL